MNTFLLCLFGLAFWIIALIFAWSWCAAAYKADELNGIQEWQQQRQDTTNEL